MFASNNKLNWLMQLDKTMFINDQATITKRYIFFRTSGIKHKSESRKSKSKKKKALLIQTKLCQVSVEKCIQSPCTETLLIYIYIYTYILLNIISMWKRTIKKRSMQQCVENLTSQPKVHSYTHQFLVQLYLSFEYIYLFKESMHKKDEKIKDENQDVKEFTYTITFLLSGQFSV